MLDWLGYVLAFLLGAMAMGVAIMIYMCHLNKKLKFELKLMLVAEGEDPSVVDEMPDWWRWQKR